MPEDSPQRPRPSARPRCARGICPLQSLGHWRARRVAMRMGIALLLIAVQAGADSRRFHYSGNHLTTAYLQQIVQPPGSSELSSLQIGKLLITQGRFRDAISYLQRALQANPNDREALRAMAHALTELNQFFQAEKMLRSLVESDTKDGESWYYLGLLLYRNGYFGTALGALEHALIAQPDNLRARIYRAVSLAKVGRAQEAMTAFRKLASEPAAAQDPDCLVVYAELLYTTGQPELALEQLDKAVAATPQAPIAHFWRARVLLHLGRVADAGQAAERSVQLAPQLPFARNLLVQIYRQQGRSQDAAKQADWLREYEDRLARGQQP